MVFMIFVKGCFRFIGGRVPQDIIDRQCDSIMLLSKNGCGAMDTEEKYKKLDDLFDTLDWLNRQYELHEAYGTGDANRISFNEIGYEIQQIRESLTADELEEYNNRGIE